MNEFLFVVVGNSRGYDSRVGGIGLSYKLPYEEYSDLNIMINFFRVDVLDNTSKSIEFIPNNLLCTLADEIIRLTGIKQKISSEDEHVSITSHISLITKLNGFQWFKFDDKIL